MNFTNNLVNFQIIRAVAVAFSLSLAAHTHTFADEDKPVLVYDNIFNTDGNYFGMEVEFGDEVILSGTARTFSQFQLEYFGEFTPAGKHKAVIRFYENDGTEVHPNVKAPGTLIFESRSLPLKPGRNAIDIKAGLNGVAIDMELPNVFTWTVALEGFDDPEDDFGIFLSDPVRIGRSFKDFWAYDPETDDFGPRLFTDNTAANFSQRVFATGGEAGEVNETIVVKPFRFEITDFDTASGNWSFLVDGTEKTRFTLESSSDLDKWTTIVSLSLGKNPLPLTFQFPLNGDQIFFRTLYADPKLDGIVVDRSSPVKGLVDVKVLGDIGLKVRLEWTSDFTEWTPLINLTLESESAIYSHVLPEGVENSFYRAIVVP